MSLKNLILPAALGVCAAVTLAPTWAQAKDCRAVTDASQRRNCSDMQDAGSAQQEPHFAEYPARKFERRVTFPDFKKRDRKFSAYRTRLRNGVRSGPNYAGHLALVEIGCGSGCRFAYLVDVRSGRVVDTGLGGDNHHELALLYRLESRLLFARWKSEDRCMRAAFEWTDGVLKEIRHVDVGAAEACNAEFQLEE